MIGDGFLFIIIIIIIAFKNQQMGPTHELVVQLRSGNLLDSLKSTKEAHNQAGRKPLYLHLFSS